MSKITGKPFHQPNSKYWKYFKYTKYFKFSKYTKYLKFHYIICLYIKNLYICIMIASDLLKGTLRTIVLKLLADNGRMYGYEITKKVEELSAGKIKLTFGALYPVLHKLEADGHIKTEEEYIGKRVRKYYSLTEKGRSWAQVKVDEFFEYVSTLSHVLNPTPA